jgi:hypothetical protein
MEHRLFRFGSLLIIVVLGIHVMLERRKPDQSSVVVAEIESEPGGPTEEVRPADQQNGILIILELIVMAGLGGVLVVTWLLPALGDSVSEAMIGSGEKVEETPRSVAAAKLAAGDYEGAIKELQQQELNHPADRYPVLEIARIYRDKMDDSNSATLTLHTALVSREWPIEDETILRLRLAEFLAADRKDFAGAREQIESIIQQHPGTPQAGAATTQLRALEEQEYRASHAH